MQSLCCLLFLLIVAKLCSTLCDSLCVGQAPLSMGFPRQECWSGLPFPLPGYLPNPEIELALAVGFLPLSYQGSLWDSLNSWINFIPYLNMSLFPLSKGRHNNMSGYKIRSPGFLTTVRPKQHKCLNSFSVLGTRNIGRVKGLQCVPSWDMCIERRFLMNREEYW